MSNERIIPSLVGDIHLGSSKDSIDTSVEFTPQNPFTIDIPKKEDEPELKIGNPGFPMEPEKYGIFETAVAKFENLSTNYKLMHKANEPLTQPANLEAQYLLPNVNDKFYHPAPPGWSPKQEIDKLTNIDPKYINKLLGSKNPTDFNYQLESIRDQENRDHVLQNGSTLGKILGGVTGVSPIGSIEDFIPLTAIATKAKVASGFISGISKNIPGLLGASAIREGAAEMDRVDGNIPSFLKDTFIDTAFATTFFGGIGAAKTLINMSELNRLKQFSRDFIDGIGFNFKVDKKGNLNGFEAVDTTGGSLGAAKVTRAQEHADAAFYKGGLFKLPYVGAASLAVISGNIPGFKYLLGSPLVRLKTSKYKSANAFADAAFDHFITTEGEAKGGVRPKSFELKMKQTRAMLTSLKFQTDALHAERNGYKIQSRPTLNIQNAWSAIKQKSIESLSRESNSTDWINREDFMDEIQHTVVTGQSSEHAAVNTGATLYRNIYDNTGHDFLSAYGLPDDYFRNMDKYLTRVYNTQYMNENEHGENGWIPVISNWFREADSVISERMQPINDLSSQIKEFEAAHTAAVEELGKRETQMNPGTEMVPYSTTIAPEMKTYQIKGRERLTAGYKELEGSQATGMTNDHTMTLASMRQKLKSMKEHLQNELRSNPEYDYHIDDRNALSANEANELKALLQPLKKVQKQIDDQKSVISNLKSIKSRKLSTTKKQETVEKATPHAKEYVAQKELIEKEEEKLDELRRQHQDIEYNLYDNARSGKINPRLYNPLNFKFKDPSDRLKFRDVFDSHSQREIHAKSAYDSIMNMHPEDIISDMFGKMIGNPETNPLKKRTLMVPDKVLYNNNFLTKDLYSKTANYVNRLARMTHLKTSFNNVTVNGNFEEIAESLLNEYKDNRDVINKRIEKLTDEKKILKEKKKLRTEAIEYNNIKKDMKRLFENRMMGINKRDDFDNMARRTWMSLTASANLHNLPATQITDLAWGGFQHGIWPSIRDGIYPVIESLGGILKTKDSEALREMAPHIHLGFQDMLNNYADRNWHSELQPYLNMGKFVSGVEKYAHFSALTDLSPYIDNGIQHIHGSVIQSRFMKLLHEQVTNGKLSNKDSLYLRKYGIDPKEWGQRMVDSYKNAGGFKTKLGGYMSKAWQWPDLEAANLFNDAVFRGVQNTLVWKGMADSPFFADNILGLFFHTFTGWTYAAMNRYMIPALQHPDGELLAKMMWMMGAGALVSPLRRLSRGEDAWPDDMTDAQIGYEAFTDSGVLSSIGNVMNIANFMSDDKLLGNLKNDKFKNRAKTGIFGMSDVVSSTASRISDVIGMANSGLDEKDMKTAAHMLPITGSMYGHYISDKLIESWNLPRNKRAAKIENG